MSAVSAPVAPPPNPLQGVPDHIRALLARLHAESKTQESALTPDDFNAAKFAHAMRDKFIALDEDKAHFVYELLRALNAKTVIEAGTSYGVSTIYLALAVAANAAATGSQGRVIGTEHEPAKAAKARKHWGECGETVNHLIDLREGDLLETLKKDLGEVDLLLLDSKSCVRQKKNIKKKVVLSHPADVAPPGIQSGLRWPFPP